MISTAGKVIIKGIIIVIKYVYLKSAATGVAISTVHTPKKTRRRGITMPLFSFDKIIPIAIHKIKNVDPMQ